MPEFAVPQSGITGNLGEDLQDFITRVEGLEVSAAEDDLQGDSYSRRLSQVGEDSDANTGLALQQYTPNQTVSMLSVYGDNSP